MLARTLSVCKRDGDRPRRASDPLGGVGFEAVDEGEGLGPVVALVGRGWAAPGVSPVGHVRMRALAHHALWDSWIHERDIAMPLGLPLTEDAEEMELILRYAVGLSPSFHASIGADKTGVLAVEATEPDLSLVVRAGLCVLVSEGTDTNAPRNR